MKIFIDSADLEEIKQAFEWGVVDGITTNPSLLKKAVEKRKTAGEALDIKTYIEQICKIAGPTSVSLEVTETTTEGMIRQGKNLYKMFNPIADNVYIKIPINPAFKDSDNTHFDGIKVIKELSAENIPTNCTLIFTPEQALLAAKAGATFVSPFAGRIDDFIRKNNNITIDKTAYFPQEGQYENEDSEEVLEDNGIVSGVDLVEQCVDIMNEFDFPTEVLAASLRNARQVRECALVGADIATLPFDVIKNMLKHKKTFEGMESFTNDIVKEYADLINK